MSTTGSVQTITPSQMKELGSAAQQAIPTSLPFVAAGYWERNKSEFIRKVGELLMSAPGVTSGSPLLAKIFADCQWALRRKFGRRCPQVDPLPASVTEEVVARLAARLARYNMRLVFLPGLEIAEDLKLRKLRNWVMPPPRFYQWMRDDKIAKDAATLRRGWYAADFTLGVDYTDGSQMMSDPWVPLIMRLREEGRVGKHDKTPAGSRFSIMPQDEWETLLTSMASFGELQFPRANVRLERYIEFNAIGNLYDPNRGKFNMWEWFADQFGDSSRLLGGSRGFGGLAHVYYHWHDNRHGLVAARPLVVL